MAEDEAPKLNDPEAWSWLVHAAAMRPPHERRELIRESEAPESLHPLLFEAANARAEALMGPLASDSSANLDGTEPHNRQPVPFAALHDVRGYDEFELLGSGGQGQVYRARHTRTNRTVAVKVRRWSEPAFEGAARFEYESLGPKERRFRKGVLGLQTLAHPSLSTVYDADIVRSPHGDFCFIAQELVEKAQPLTTSALGLAGSRERLELFGQLVEAIDYAHSQGVVHRDLKPGNVLVGGDGHLVVIDFDAAQASGSSILFSSTSGGADISIHYTSPEQLRGERVDHRADIYSLGVILHEMMTGDCPSLRDGIRGLADAVLLYDPPRIPGQRSRLERDMESISLRCMRKRPSERYPDAAAVLADVNAALRGEAIEARPVALYDRISQFVRRHRMRVAAATALAAGVAAIYFSGRTQALANEKSGLEDEVTLFRDVTTALRMDEELNRIDVTSVIALEELDLLQGPVQALLGMESRYRQDLEALEAQGRSVASERIAQWERMHPMAAEIESVALYLRDQEERTARGEEVDTELFERGRAYQAESIRLRDRDRPMTMGTPELSSELFLKRLAAHKAAELEDSWLLQWDQRRSAASRVRDAWDSDKALWEEVARDLLTDERFAGFRLVQQRGLRPLGKDPESGLHEFAHLASNVDVARRASAGERVRPEIGTGLTMVLVPGADVILGRRGANEHSTTAPKKMSTGDIQYRASLDPHFVSKYELTQDQCLYLFGRNPSNWTEQVIENLSGPPLLYPAERIDLKTFWPVFLAHGLDFPTAAQSEYAARAGTTTLWSFGNDEAQAHLYGNFNDESAEILGGPNWPGHNPKYNDGFPCTAPVGSLLSNPWGLYDVHGNVAEQTKCDFGASRTRKIREGDGWRAIPGSPIKVQRGGSYMFGTKSSSSSHVVKVDKTERHMSVGVRPVRLVRGADGRRLSSEKW